MAVTENLANQDYPYVDPAFELLNTGVQSAGNMMQGFTDLGNGFYQDTFGRVFNLGQKKMVNPMMSGIQPVVQQSSVIDDYITSLGQSNTTQNNDGSQTISGGTTNPADDIVMTNLPKPIFQPTMADVAGPSSNNNNIQPASTPSRPAYSPQDMNIQPASAPSETNNSRNRFGRFGRANGGLVSMARVLKR